MRIPTSASGVGGKYPGIAPKGDIVFVRVTRNVAGGTSGTSLEMPDVRTSEEYKLYKAKYCIDDSLLAGVAKEKAAVGDEKQAYYEQRIDYILKTGANWKDPIGTFHLTLDKGLATSTP